MFSVGAEKFNRAVKVGSYRSSGLSHQHCFCLPTSGKQTAVTVLYETETLVRVEEVWAL